MVYLQHTKTESLFQYWHIIFTSTPVSTCLSTSGYECLNLHSAMESGSHASEKSL